VVALSLLCAGLRRLGRLCLYLRDRWSILILAIDRLGRLLKRPGHGAASADWQLRAFQKDQEALAPLTGAAVVELSSNVYRRAIIRDAYRFPRLASAILWRLLRVWLLC
jgi:hypothetical protein